MGSEYFVLPILILLLYIAVKAVQSGVTITVRGIGIALIIIGLSGIIFTPSVLTGSQVQLENIEKYQGIENVREYNESEYIPIGSDEVIEIVVDEETHKVELLSQDGKNLETIRRGRTHIQSQNLKKYDVVVVKVIDHNGETIDRGNLTVRTSYQNTDLQ